MNRSSITGTVETIKRMQATLVAKSMKSGKRKIPAGVRLFKSDCNRLPSFRVR